MDVTTESDADIIEVMIETCVVALLLDWELEMVELEDVVVELFEVVELDVVLDDEVVDDVDEDVDDVVVLDEVVEDVVELVVELFAVVELLELLSSSSVSSSPVV